MGNNNIKNASSYYNSFFKEKANSTINLRHLTIFRYCNKMGVSSKSNFLELGCGNGKVTGLLTKIISNGQIESVDFSEETIAFLKQKNQNKVSFYYGNIVEYKPTLKNIDFVGLFDVLEHIPIELHNQLFENITGYINGKTKILINIPHPNHIQYDIENRAGVLQIIDQSVYIKDLLLILNKHNLVITYLKNISIWEANDYQFFVIEVNKNFNPNLKTKNSLMAKIKNKLTLYLFNKKSLFK